MKKLLLLITGLLLLFSVEGQILRYSNYVAPIPEELGPFPIVTSITETTTNSTDVSSHPIYLPVTTSTGDLLVVFFASDGNPGLSIDAGDSSEGWVIENSNVSSTTVRGAVIWTIVDETESLTLSTTTGQISMAQTYRITNYETSDPISITHAVWPTGAANPPSNTGDYSADDYLWIVAYAGDSYDSRASAAPADFSDLAVTGVSVGGGCSVSSAQREHNTADAYDPGAFTMTVADEWVAWTVIINPIQP